MTKLERLQIVQEKILSACKRSGRTANDVTLVGVSKTKSAEEVFEFLSLGLKNFGENYLQEALPKIDTVANLSASHASSTQASTTHASISYPTSHSLPAPCSVSMPHWHFIGQLQSNKAKLLPGKFEWVHSLDSSSSAKKISQQATTLGLRQKCLIQVNIDNEPTKAGVLPADVIQFMEEIGTLPGLDLRGLMCIPDPSSHQDPKNPFRELRNLLEKCRAHSENPNHFRELSMGMSHDFEAAIEEGSTFVRIGTSLFGERLK